jgi:hypothetical protein
MYKLSISEQATVIRALVEGNSINSTYRMFGVGKPMILRLIKSFGEVCQEFHDERVCNLETKRVELDELWAFVHCKQRNIPDHLQGVDGIGEYVDLDLHRQ